MKRRYVTHQGLKNIIHICHLKYYEYESNRSFIIKSLGQQKPQHI